MTLLINGRELSILGTQKGVNCQNFTSFVCVCDVIETELQFLFYCNVHYTSHAAVYNTVRRILTK